MNGMNALDALVLTLVLGALALGAWSRASSLPGGVLLPADTQLVLATAGRYAGPRLCTVTHLAMALLSDVEIAGLLGRSSASLDDLYEDFDHLLATDASLAPPASLVRAASRRTFRPRPRDLLAALLVSNHEARAVFEKHRVTSTIACGERPVRAPASPYRNVSSRTVD